MYLAVERSTAEPKFPSASSAVQHMPELASAGGNKKSYDTIFELPNKAKSGPLEAAGSSVQLCPVLAGPSGCWSAGALAALSGTVNHWTRHTCFPGAYCNFHI